MRCEEILEILWQTQARETSPETRKEVEGHLQNCPACSREEAALRKVVQNLPRPPNLPGSYWSSYNQKIIRRLQARTPYGFLSVKRWGPAFALALFLAGGTAFYVLRGKEGKIEMDEIIDQIEVLDNLEILDQEDFDKKAVRAAHEKS